MSKDPLGNDPLGIDPIVNICQVGDQRLQKAISAYAKNILLKGTTVADTITPGEPIGEDGKPLTLERRVELAAARTPYDVKKARAGELDYSKDAPPIETEKIGESAQREIDKQPDMTIVTPKDFKLVPLTPEQTAELNRDNR